MKPFVVVSDIHAHAWSAFSKTNPDGVNNRLQHILDELDHAATELLEAGGDTMVVAGDIFHQRGAIHPAVFNPVFARFQSISDRGIKILALPGNHDLATKETTWLGNSFASLHAIERFEVRDAPVVIYGMAFIPWRSNLDALRADVERLKEDHDVSGIDLFIHAGINGVIAGLPDHGLNAPEVAAWGFRRVFAGHYHNHKVMEDGKVISIGALTHQTWGDIGTKAGFLLVHEDRVEYRASHAPSFVEVNEDTDQDDIPLIVDGNYARIRGLRISDAEVAEMRDELESYGCLGLNFQVIRETVSARTTTAKGLTLEESVDKFADSTGFRDMAALKAECASVLADIRARVA